MLLNEEKLLYVGNFNAFEPNLHFTKSVRSSHVFEAINLLKTCMSFDSVHNNHLKFLNFCFIHNYFPREMPTGVITLIVKKIRKYQIS